MATVFLTIKEEESENWTKVTPWAWQGIPQPPETMGNVCVGRGVCPNKTSQLREQERDHPTSPNIKESPRKAPPKEDPG